MLLAGLIVGGIFFYNRLRQQTNAPAPYNAYLTQASELQQQPVPGEPIDKAIYYSQLAQNYNAAKYYDQALNNFLQAQAIIDQNNLQDQIVFYRPIADVYKAKNDKTKEREYLQKYAAYLHTYLQTHPDDIPTSQVIKDIEQEMNHL